MQADSAIPGTELTGMHQCIGHWLVDKDLKADYRVRSVVAPGIGEIACAVERGDTVALELGFWWGDATGGVNRCGGHWVAVSGVDLPRSPGPDGEPGVAGADDDGDGKVDDLDELCPCGAAGLTTYGDDFCPGPQRLARLGLSDPAFNNAEPPPAGAGGMGRVLGPDHANHAGSVLPVLPSHDDAQNVSHDVYFVRPGGLVFPLLNVLGYASADPAEPSVACAQVHRFCGQNPFPGIDLPFDACDPSDNVRISVEIEAMLALGPITNQVCLDFTGTDPAPLSVTLGPPIGPPCPAGVAGSTPLDYIRGQGCQLGFVPSTVPTAVTLGEVDVLEEQTPLLAWVDDTTPINTDPGVWYFLVKQPPPLNYGFGSDGLPRQAGRPPCP